MTTSILLVDDHPIFLKGLRSLLEDEADMKVVGEAGDGQTALDLIKTLSPGIVVMDITMPGLNGIEATKQISLDFPKTKVIALSIHSDKEFVEGMLQAGAVGYIVKESVPEELVKGIRTVKGGESYLSPAITGLIISQFRQGLSQGQSHPGKHIEIIETKLHTPSTGEDHVHRSRLVALLEKNRHLPLQNIIAPAGYGKTTLVSCWLQSQDWPNSWLSLDKEDNDLHRFMSYFIHGVQTLFPMALSQSAEFLNPPALPPIQILAGRLANELNLIEQDFILVLDDFNLIIEKKIHDLIVEVLRYPPKPMHLILVSRLDPFLPIATLRAQGQLNEIRLQDLRFTREETAEYLQPMTGEPLAVNVIDKLVERTEGWITALRLAALSLRHKTDFDTLLSELNGSPEYVMEYLFHEVLSSQPGQIRDYLLKTAILDRFCAPLCDTLFGTKEIEPGKDELDSWAFISVLKKENMFILNLDTDNNWFRYHHLFQQLLKNQLRRYKTPDEIAVLYGRASKWFADEGFPDEAIKYALAAGDTQAAADIVEQNRSAVLDADQWHTLGKWLDRLPHDIQQERPKLLLGRAWINLLLTRVGEIVPIMDRIQSLVDTASADPEVLSEINFFQGLLCYFQCRAEQSTDLFNTAAKLMPKTAFVALKSHIEYWSCMALHLDGRNEKAVQTLHQGILQKDAQQGLPLSRLRFGLCFIHMLDGEWAKAFSEGLKLLEVSRSNHLAFSGAWSMYVMGNASFQMFDLRSAQDHFSQAMENRYIKNHRAAVDAMAGLALTHQFMGNPADADETMTLALEYAQWTKDPGNLEVVHSCRARIAILQGDLVSASRWQEMLGEITGHQIMIFFLEIPVITECRVLIAMGSEANVKQALEKLADLYQKSKSWQNTCQMVEIMILQALACKCQDRVDDALAILEAAVTLAIPGNWIRPFVEPGPPMEAMLRQLRVKEIAVEFIDRLLVVFKEGVSRISPVMTILADPVPLYADPSTIQALKDPLTKRELEILDLLAQHLYNKEIAEKLYISPETVKTHLKKIYEKLEVASRRDAVSRSKELGLVVR